MPLTSKDDSIERIAAKDPGYLLTKDILAADISHPYLYDYLERHPEFERIERGIYVNTSIKNPDNMYILYLKRKVIYSHLSALFLLGIIEKEVEPAVFDVTFPHNYNRGRMHGNNLDINRFVEGENLNAFVCSSSDLEKGIVEAKTIYGHTVKCYCADRAVCEVVKDRNRFSDKQYREAINGYFDKAKCECKDFTELLMYADMFKVRETMMDYINLLGYGLCQVKCVY